MKQLNTPIRDYQHDWLRQLAFDRHISIAEIIRDIIDRAISNSVAVVANDSRTSGMLDVAKRYNINKLELLGSDRNLGKAVICVAARQALKIGSWWGKLDVADQESLAILTASIQSTEPLHTKIGGLWITAVDNDEMHAEFNGDLPEPDWQGIADAIQGRPREMGLSIEAVVEMVKKDGQPRVVHISPEGGIYVDAHRNLDTAMRAAYNLCWLSDASIIGIIDTDGTVHGYLAMETYAEAHGWDEYAPQLDSE